MKEQEKLIREYYASHEIAHGSTILFSYVKKELGGDGCKIEYWAARRGHIRGKRGKDIVAKLVMTFDPAKRRYSMSDSVIRYTTWSMAIPDHLIYDFRREMTGCRNYPIEIGKGRFYYHGDWRLHGGEIMPTSEIPLNDFSGTRYEYCNYVFKNEYICAFGARSLGYWGKNPFGNLPDYLRKFDINPRAMEMFGKLGLVKFMRESFLVRLRDDWEFAPWYKRHAKETVGLTITQIYNRARKEIGRTCWEICHNEERRLERIRRARLCRLRMARHEREEERRRIEAEKRERVERMNRAKRIKRLYLKLKSICVEYGAYEVVVPKSQREMENEGKRMHNCIGKMYPSRQGVDRVIVFLHKDGKPCVDVEVDMKTFKVLQCRRTCNENACEREWEIAGKVASDIMRIYKNAA